MSSRFDKIELSSLNFYLLIEDIMRIQFVTKNERAQAEILERLLQKEITQEQAGLMLKISERQVRRKLKKFLKGGIKGLIHKGKGRPSKRMIDPGLKKRALQEVAKKYSDYGPTLAAEMLADHTGIELIPQTLRRFMMEAGMWKKGYKREIHRQWRDRKDRYGEMQQLDGSEHDWFEGRAPYCTLIKFVDDATSKITWAEFAPSESFCSLANATKNYLLKNGKPLALYTDRGKVFKVNIHNELDEFLTAYERILKELGIRLHHALSPQAKGRIERSFRTDQDRLVKLMRLKKISSIEEANQFLQEFYIPYYNGKFSVPAKLAGDVHLSLQGVDLDDAFSLRSIRVVNNDWTVQYNNHFFQLHKKQPRVVRPKEKVYVRERTDGTIFIVMRGCKLNFSELKEAPPNKKIYKKSLTVKVPKEVPRWIDPKSLLPGRSVNAGKL